MQKSKVYIPDPKDIIDKFKIDNLVSKGALQPVENVYVMDEDEVFQFAAYIKGKVLDGSAKTNGELELCIDNYQSIS